MPYPLSVHPVLFNIGPILIPSYGAMAAFGVLLALIVAQRLARAVGILPNQLWNLCVVALFAALIGARLLLIFMNWHDLTRHPLWMLGLATVHHPLLAAAGALLGALGAALYARWRRMPLLSTADAVAVPLAIGLGMEQIGALMAGSGFGTEASVPWAVTYTSPLAARWSGAPLGVPLHPVQAYAAFAFLMLAIILLLWLRSPRQQGDLAGGALAGIGIIVFFTEFFRDWEGRGVILHGVIDAPQAVAVLFVLAGAMLLREGRHELTPASQPSESNAAGEAHPSTGIHHG